MNKLSTALWFSTYACQYSCPYCWQNTDRKSMPHFVAPPPYDQREQWACDWAAAWNRVSPGILDISGGEPTLLPLPELVRALDPSIRVAITTNLSNTGMVYELGGENHSGRISSWTLSFHQTQMTKPGSEERFWAAAKFLGERGFSVSVNFVGFPDQFYALKKVENSCHDHGVRFHFDPYSVPPGRDAPAYTDEQRTLIESYTGKDRAPILGVDKVTCPAGRTHVTVFPDGEVYRCLAESFSGYKPIGNLLDPEFSLTDADSGCTIVRGCAGCDRDKVRSHWTAFK